mgnify:CR=1 FL=1
MADELSQVLKTKGVHTFFSRSGGGRKKAANTVGININIHTYILLVRETKLK